jgi:glycosyltransferase involved in cell wall biosynthesis
MIAPPWISVPPANYGGTEAVIAFLVKELVAQGHDVTLFASGDSKTSAKLVSFYPRSLTSEGVPWQAHLKAYYHLHKSLEQAGAFEIVHTHLSSTSDMFIFPLMSRLATPHVTTLHSNFPFDRTGEWVGVADTYFMEWMQKVPLISISENARKELMKPLTAFAVVHHGLDADLLKPAPVPLAPYFAWLGRFIRQKGPHVAIEAARLAGVPLVLAGIIDQAEYFETQIRPHIDGNQVSYIGPVNTEQKIDLLSRARGFLNPIDWPEPFGVVMIEALAMGCPVITFDRGAAPEIVSDPKCGFLVHDLAGMVDAIGRIDQIDRADVRRHFERHFSSDAMARNYTRVYEQVIAAKARGQALHSR